MLNRYIENLTICVFSVIGLFVTVICVFLDRFDKKQKQRGGW